MTHPTKHVILTMRSSCCVGAVRADRTQDSDGVKDIGDPKDAQHCCRPDEGATLSEHTCRIRGHPTWTVDC